MRLFLRYVLAMVLIIALAAAMLYAAGLVPQSALKQHMQESMDQLTLEGVNPGVLYAGHPRSTLDNYSEARILLHSYYMDTAASPEAALTNPGWEPSASTKETTLPQMKAAVESDASANLHYSRYWMGFRAVVRPLMLLMNLMDMRQLIQWAFLLLLGAASLLLYRKTSSFWIALGFVFVISQLNPVVIAGSFQFSACFFLAFAGMILALLPRRKSGSAAMLFFVLGAATQYFDFYTAPILTFGLPMLALLLRFQHTEHIDFRFRSTLRVVLACFAAWMIAYVAMWLAKLTLTSLLTGEPAFAEAFDKVRAWVIDPSPEGNGLRMIWLALFNCTINLADPAPLALEGILLLLFFLRVIRIRPEWRIWSEQAIYLFVALLPVLWIAAAAKPAYHHMYFQYRGLGVTMLGGFLFLFGVAFPRREKEKMPAAVETEIV